MSHILILARRISQEIVRDEFNIIHAVIGPIATLWIVKLVSEGISQLALEYVPMEALGIGFVAMLIHFSGYVLCTLVIIRERISGTLERVFMATYERSEILLGYCLGYSTLIFAQTVIVLIVSKYFYNLHYGKNLLAVFVITFLLGIVSIGLAMFVSNFARRESHAMIAIPLILLPAFLLSGLIFPIEALPKFLKALSYFFPLRYAILPLQDILLRGLTFWQVKLDFIGLFGYGVITLVLGSLTLKDRE